MLMRKALKLNLEPRLKEKMGKRQHQKDKMCVILVSRTYDKLHVIIGT